MKKKKFLVGLFMMLLCTMAVGMSSFAAETTLKNKKWVSGGATYVDTDNDGIPDIIQGDDTTYYKIQIPKQGYIKVEVKQSSAPGAAEYWSEGVSNPFDESCTYIKFINAEKAELDSQMADVVDIKKITFTEAVKKGTYYLAVDSEAKYKIRYSFTAVSKVNKAATKSSKAVKLSSGKMVKALIFPNKKDEIFYYKLTLAKAKKITLSVNYQIKNSEGSLRMNWIDVWKKVSKKKYLSVNSKGETSSDYLNTWTVSGKGKITLNLSAGTYYIRVIPHGSGYYTLQWK